MITPPPALLDHLPGDGLSHEKHASKVHGQDRVELRLARPEERLYIRHTRHAGKDVDPPVAVHRLSDGFVDVFGVTDVGDHVVKLGLVTKLLPRFRQVVVIDIDADDAGAVVVEAPGNGQPQPPGPARHQ